MKENIWEGEGLLSVVVLNFSETEWDMSGSGGLNKAKLRFRGSF